jgi:hypothetical protein
MCCCVGDNYVQMILKEGLPLVADTLECTIPRNMLANDIRTLMIWYRTVIDELQRISQEVWFMDKDHSMVHDAIITPDAEIKLHFFCFRLRLHVRHCHKSTLIVELPFS